MTGQLSNTPSIAEKLDEIAPLQCFHAAPPDSTLTVVSLEREDVAIASTSTCSFSKRWPRNLSTLRELSGLMSDLTRKDYVSRVIFLTQNNSFRPLNVTRDMMEALLEEHEINPRFVDTVSSFCSKVSNAEDSLCLPFWMHQSARYLEYGYVFKYPVQSERKGNPWYVRQTAVCHQLRRSDCRSTYVVVSPYPDTRGQKVVMEWFQAQNLVSQVREQAFGIHDVLFKCYLSKHRAFATEFEEKIENLSMKMLSVGLRDIQSVTPQDMASLNHIQVKLLPQRHALLGFQRVLNGLDRALTRWAKVQRCDTGDLSEQWEDLLANRRSEIDSYQANSEALQQKCTIASQLLGSILEFNNRSIADLQRRIASQQNERVSLLTQFTVNDSITVRVVTAISLVFLCAATVAAIMDTPCFYLDEKTHKIHVSPSAWVYLVLCVPLTCVTLGYWRWSLARKKRQRVKYMAQMQGGFFKVDEAIAV